MVDFPPNIVLTLTKRLAGSAHAQTNPCSNAESWVEKIPDIDENACFFKTFAPMIDVRARPSYRKKEALKKNLDVSRKGNRLPFSLSRLLIAVFTVRFAPLDKTKASSDNV